MAKKKGLDAWTLWLAILGAIVLGLFGFGYDVVSAIFGSWAKWVYFVFGLSGLYQGYKHL